MNYEEAKTTLEGMIKALAHHIELAECGAAKEDCVMNREKDLKNYKGILSVLKGLKRANETLEKDCKASKERMLDQSLVLRVLKEHTWLLDYMGSVIPKPPKSPAAYHVRICVDADESCFPIIDKWIKEKKK